MVLSQAEIDQIIADGVSGLSVGLPGDFDNDTDVDGADFLVWQRDPSNKNLSDWQSNYGTTSALATASAVPEPGSLCLALLGMGILVFRGKSLSRKERGGPF